VQPERREVFQAGHRRGFRDHQRGVVQRAGTAQGFDGVDHGGAFLADQHIDARDVLAALVDHRIDGERALAGAVVADDQLPLPLADRDQRIDDLVAGIHRLLDEIARDDRRRTHIEQTVCMGIERPAVVERRAERVDHPTQQIVADPDAQTPAGQEGRCARGQALGLAQQDRPDPAARQVEHQRAAAVFHLHDFVHARRRQAADPRDAVTDRRHRALLGQRSA